MAEETTPLQDPELSADGRRSNIYGAVGVSASTESLAQTHAAEVEAHRPKGMKLAVIIGSLWVVLFIAALDGTIVVTLINSIASSFKASEKSGWLSTSYLLSVCAFSSVYGRLCDIVGRRGAMLIAVTFFTLGTCLCATAASMNQLLVARFVAGIGGGGMLTCGSILMSDIIPLRQRGLWQGITNVLFGSASALGGPLGGFMNDFFGWRMAFASQVPLLLVGGCCIATFVNIPLPQSDQTLRKKLGRIDYLGSLMLISGSSCLLLAMNFLSVTGLPFKDLRVWGLLVAFLGCAVIFIIVEARFVKEPVMPPALLVRRTPGLVSASFFLGSAAHMATIFHFPLWFQSVRLQTASQAGLHLIPISLGAACGSLWAGLYMKKTGKYWHANIFCCFLNIASTGYASFWNHSTPAWVEYVTFVPQAFGTSAIFTFMLLAMISSVKQADMATATGNVYLFRSLGSVVGVGLSTALFQTLLSSALLRNITPDLLPRPEDGMHGVRELITSIRHDASIVSHLQPIKLRQAAQTSYMTSIRSMFLLSAIVNVVYLLVCWPVEENELKDATSKRSTTSESHGSRPHSDA